MNYELCIMNYKRAYVILCLAALSFTAGATDYAALQDSVATGMQLRTGADFNFKFDRVTLNFGEELRFNLMPTAEVHLANTYLEADVNIIRGYFHGHAGYSLRARTGKLGTTTDVNKILRHRVYFGLTEHVKLGTLQRFTLSLRERAVLNIRTDSPNLFEKPAYAWDMRYRLQLQYKAASKPLTPYLWTELVHTCNATEYQKYYNNSHNYISAVKAAVGLKWKLDATNTLNFYVRYDWSHDFDIDANKEGTTVKTAYDIRQHLAIIGVEYKFGWKK